jgi:hypothetical protein
MTLTKKHLKIVLILGAFLIANQYMGWFDLSLFILAIAALFVWYFFDPKGEQIRRKNNSQDNNFYNNDNYFDHQHNNHHDCDHDNDN